LTEKNLMPKMRMKGRNINKFFSSIMRPPE